VRCTSSHRRPPRPQEEVDRLEAIARATGERAAAAEAQAAGRGEQIVKAYAELAALRERYHAELSELKAARISGAEVARTQERLDAMQATNASLVAARCGGATGAAGAVVPRPRARRRFT
jgi:hypothetical protein